MFSYQPSTWTLSLCYCIIENYYWTPSSSWKGPTISSLFFSKFRHSVRNTYLVARGRSKFFRKILSPREFLKIDIFFWICSVMKVFSICCVSVQILYLGKIWFVRYRPKCAQPVRLCPFDFSHFYGTNSKNSLIFCMLTQIIKIKSLLKFFGRP